MVFQISVNIALHGFQYCLEGRNYYISDNKMKVVLLHCLTPEKWMVVVQNHHHSVKSTVKSTGSPGSSPCKCTVKHTNKSILENGFPSSLLYSFTIKGLSVPGTLSTAFPIRVAKSVVIKTTKILVVVT